MIEQKNLGFFKVNKRKEDFSFKNIFEDKIDEKSDVIEQKDL